MIPNPRLDIVIPVYNEGSIILATLAELRRQVTTPSRILICYDSPDDDTLSTIKAHPDRVEGLTIEFVRNRSRGAHAAVMAGFTASQAPFVLVFPADDDFNAGIIDAMVAKGEQGVDVVLRQPLYSRRLHGRLPLAQGLFGPHRRVYALLCGAPADQGRNQRISTVFAASDRAH